MCKVRQCRIHSTRKLLLSTESGLKRSRHDAVPNSREFSLFAFWEWLGTVPSPGTKQKALKSCSNSHLSAHCSASLFQQRDWQGSHRFGCRPFLPQTPPTARAGSRIKALILCHRKSLSSEESSWDCIHGVLIVFGNCRRWKDTAETCQQQQPSARGCHFTEKQDLKQHS